MDLNYLSDPALSPLEHNSQNTQINILVSTLAYMLIDLCGGIPAHAGRSHLIHFHIIKV